MRFLLPFLLLTSLTGYARDTTIFQLKWRNESLLYGAGAVGTSLSYLAASKVPALTVGQVTMANPGQVPRFDRWSIGNYSHTAATGSDILLYGSMILPEILVLADPATRKSSVKHFVILSEVFAVNYGITALTKELTHRSRPYVYDPLVPMEIRTDCDARRSFFSGHTSSAAAMCFGYATIWSSYHSDSRLKPLVWTGAALVPAVTGYLRVRAGEHFLSDVLAGYGTGAICGWLVARWHRKRSSR